MAEDSGAKMTDDLVQKYRQRLAEQLDVQGNAPSGAVYSREYNIFRKELQSKPLSWYEKLCQFSGQLLKFSVKPERYAKMQSSIDACHLQVTPSSVMAASVVLPVLLMVLGIFGSLLIFDSLFFAMFFLIIGVACMALLQKLPDVMANIWRMKGSNQMVLCIFYVVTYMRHTSNLELAIEFAAEHLAPPLSLDLRKVLWDVESGKFETVKESLEKYLDSWRGYNMEFVESFHLVESSLYETSEERRLSLLDKSLDVILEETYEKMLHYAQNLKGPITMLHMLGVILPILGLVILPLMVSFMEGVRWYHIAALYNIVLPITVYLLGRNILSKRPTGYGDTDVSEMNPALKKYRNIIVKLGSFEFVIHPVFVCVLLGAAMLLIALSPLIIHTLNPAFDITLDHGKYAFIEYKPSLKNETLLIGPFGIGAAMLSLFFPLALALSFGLYFRLRSKNVIKIRNEAKKLEDEFASALFQLGNRLGDGLPAEVAFQRVADVLEDSTAGRFFKLVAANISRQGMSVRDAIFNPTGGALVFFPSAIIQSSMKVLIESVKKGPRIAAQGMLNVARYIKEIHRVNERLQDLMADIISDMKSQIAFLTPAIAGVVIGITSMITYILGRLSTSITAVGTEGADFGNLATFFGDGMPTYYFQAVVGIYVFQIVYILTIMSNGVENGADSLQERYLLGNNLLKSTILYCLIAGIVMLIFQVIAAQIVDVAVITAG